MNSVLPEPVSFEFDYLARNDESYEKELSLLNSYSKGLLVHDISIQATSSLNHQPSCIIHNIYVIYYFISLELRWHRCN